MRKSVEITALGALILLCAGIIIRFQETEPLKAARQNTVEFREKLPEIKKSDAKRDLIASMQGINADFKAFLAFESGLIALPVVQSDNNSFYLDHTFERDEGTAGTLFFDTQCERDDRLRIIYGHTVFGEDDLMFSPLHNLADPGTFASNRRFSLFYPDGAEHYEIMCVFVNDEDDENALNTRIRNFVSEEEEEAFLDAAKEQSLIMSEDMDALTGKLLILQTCIDEHSAKRLCVLAYEKGGG